MSCANHCCFNYDADQHVGNSTPPSLRHPTRLQRSAQNTSFHAQPLLLSNFHRPVKRHLLIMAPNLKAGLGRLRTRLGPRKTKVCLRHLIILNASLLSHVEEISPSGEDIFNPLSTIQPALPRDFFTIFPRELRDIIYDHLLGSLVAHVVAGRKAWRHQPDTIEYRATARSSGKAIYDRLIGPGHIHTSKIFQKKKGNSTAIVIGKNKPCVPALLVNRQFCRELLERVHWHSIIGVTLPYNFCPSQSIPAIVGETYARSLWLTFVNTERVTDLYAYLRTIVEWCAEKCANFPKLASVSIQVYMIYMPSDHVWSRARSIVIKDICESWPLLKSADIITFAKQIGKGKDLMMRYAKGHSVWVTFGQREQSAGAGDAGKIPYCIRVEKKGLGRVLSGVGKGGK